LTKKIQCQLIDWVRTPPTRRPIAPPAEATNAKAPMAFACSRGSGNIVTIIPRITAEVSAPPTPCRKRAATSISWLVARAAEQRRDAEYGTTMRTDRRPGGQIAEPPGEQQKVPEAIRYGGDHRRGSSGEASRPGSPGGDVDSPLALEDDHEHAEHSP
jgi:hypothetical protein